MLFLKRTFLVLQLFTSHTDYALNHFIVYFRHVLLIYKGTVVDRHLLSPYLGSESVYVMGSFERQLLNGHNSKLI